MTLIFFGVSDDHATVDRATAVLAERAEAEAWAEMQLGMAGEVRARLGVEVWRPNGGVALLARHMDVAAVNRVIGLGLDAPLAAGELDALVATYGAAVPRFIVQWSPVAAPREAREWFVDRGFRAGTPTVKLYRRADANVPDPPTTGALRVAPVDPADAHAFARMVAGPLGAPPDLEPGVCSTVGHASWRHYFVLDGDRPVAGAALSMHGDVAWCGVGATVAEARGRGAQSLLIARRIRDAAAAGCTLLVVETARDTPEKPNPSYRNLRRAGFAVLYERPNYVWERAAKPTGGPP